MCHPATEGDLACGGPAWRLAGHSRAPHRPLAEQLALAAAHALSRSRTAAAEGDAEDAALLRELARWRALAAARVRERERGWTIEVG